MAAKKNTNYLGIKTSKKRKEFWMAMEPAKFIDWCKRNDTLGDDAKISHKGNTIMMRCRSQGHAGVDENPSMAVNLGRGYSKCHTCGAYYNDLGELLAPMFKKDAKTVLKELQSHFNIKIIKADDFLESDTYRKHVEMKNALAKVLNYELVTAIDLYRAGTLAESELYASETTIKYMETRSPLILDVAERLPIGTFVSSVRLETTARSMGISASVIKDMQTYLIKYFLSYYIGALVFISHENYNDVSRFRLRMPDVISENGKAEKKITAIEDLLTKRLGIFGFGNMGGVLDANGKNPKALLFEGEFDALLMMVNQMAVNDPEWVPLCHSGNANGGDLSPLETSSIQDIYYVPDNDAGGVTNAKNILQKNHGLKIYIYNQSQGLRVANMETSDICDSINAFGFEKVSQELKELKKNYAARVPWAKSMAYEECKNLDPSDETEFGKIKDITHEYSLCVGDINSSQKHDTVKKFIAEVLTTIGVSSADITSITVSASAEGDPEQEFIQLLGLTLNEQFSFIANDVDEKKVTLWDKKKRFITNIRTSSEAATKVDIGNMIGDIRSWVIGQVPGGIPKFIKYADEDGKQPKNYLQIDNSLGDFIRMAIRHKLPDLRSMDKYDYHATGSHWVKTSIGEKIVVVNGNHAYVGSFTEDNLVWDELPVPTIDDVYFDLSKNKWSDNIESVQDLRNAPDVPLHKILERNVDLISTGWTFVNQDPEANILGALATIMTVLKIFPTNLQFLASNERSCGKSALYAECFGGGKNTEFNITEHTQYADNITPAGMKQSMNGAATCLILDEFDNQRGSRGTQEKQEEVLTMLRTSSGGNGIFVQGTTTGKSKEYKFSVSTMMAGIDPEMSEANQTRLITTDLQSGLDGRLPPHAAILSKFSKAEIDELRKWNSVSTFKHIPALLRSYNEIQKELIENPDALGEGVMQRFKDSLILLVCVYKAAYPGTNKWKEVGIAICKAKESKLSSLKSATANADLIDCLLHTNGIEVVSPMEKKVYSLAQLLSSSAIQSSGADINLSNAGVWFQPSLIKDHEGNTKERFFVFIQWKNLASTLLKYNNRWKQSPAQLKTIASRHPDVLKDDPAKIIYEKEKAIPGWVGSGGDGAYSVLDVTEMVLEGAARETAFHSSNVATESPTSTDATVTAIEDSGFGNI